VQHAADAHGQARVFRINEQAGVRAREFPGAQPGLPVTYGPRGSEPAEPGEARKRSASREAAGARPPLPGPAGGEAGAVRGVAGVDQEAERGGDGRRGVAASPDQASGRSGGGPQEGEMRSSEKEEEEEEGSRGFLSAASSPPLIAVTPPSLFYASSSPSLPPDAPGDRPEGVQAVPAPHPGLRPRHPRDALRHHASQGGASPQG
jgi:hypothetical protein